jgi:hypothetical protein
MFQNLTFKNFSYLHFLFNNMNLTCRRFLYQLPDISFADVSTSVLSMCFSTGVVKLSTVHKFVSSKATNIRGCNQKFPE